MPAFLNSLLVAAQARRDAGDWKAAIRLFRQAEQKAADAPAIKHNLAVCYYADGDHLNARLFALAALTLEPRFWQSYALIAKMSRAKGDIDAAATAWRAVLAVDPDNGTALLGLADLDLNEYGDPQAATARVAPLHQDSFYAADAELTRLMAALYTGEEDAASLSARLRAFAAAYLVEPRFAQRPLRRGRRRIGLVSPLLSISPVYYLTFSTFAALAEAHDLVIFNRGIKEDLGTHAFRSIAAEWQDVASLDSSQLAGKLHEAELDILFDLGGWSDVIALQALSAKPASRLYKWVGGQSATTGLATFDGWIGDEWQCPHAARDLYSEPVVVMHGGYVDYLPPPVLQTLRHLPKRGVALVGNPAKIQAEGLAHWPEAVTSVTLIDRRYARERTRARVTELLERRGIAVETFITPGSHEDYLRALASHQAIVNTRPYAAGLTAVEALNLGLDLLSEGPDGRLFSSRHHLSHMRTRGRNPALARHMLDLVSA